MAEKKFFVDINLQGSALTNAKIGTNSGIGSTEGAFGYDSSAHRLQYFDGTATKEVANLSDIAAVTGGLIFQGGYNPTTNTPDIADGSALKGFFWAATAAGTFLGESVQVGDSIVAKVDNAGATIADWLILQGNIVIATDSVDGISRLATQTEANDGTEGGAVVITPATLQGKIDAQITPEINSKLPLSGGTMSGNIDMNTWGLDNVDHLGGYDGKIFLYDNLDAENQKTIINLPAPTNGGDAANKTYVDDNTNNKLPLAGGTMSGEIIMDGHAISNASSITAEEVAPQILATTTNDGVLLVTANALNFNNLGKVTNLPAPTNDGDAANKEYVDGAASTAQSAAEAYADSLAPNYDAAGAAATAESNANAYTDTAINNNSGRIILPSGDWLDSGSGDYYQIVDVSAYTVGFTSPITQIVSATGEVLELAITLENAGLLRVSSNMPGNGFDWAVLVTKAL